MSTLMRRHLTPLELAAVIALALMVGGLLWVQKTAADSRHRDSVRKQNLNAMYYYLENVYYPQHHGYPATLTRNTLPGFDAAQLTDPTGKSVSDGKGDYTYLPTACQDGVCGAYKLTGTLEKEAPFNKTSTIH